MRKFGLTIIVENTGKTFHTYNDWGLYIQNTDYIGEPLQVTNIVQVPGREGYIDLSKSLDGHAIYSSRPISVELAGFHEKQNWDGVVSKFRNEISGRTCQFIFDNDTGYYWRGKVAIKDFSSILSVGKLRIDLPEAEPYKYSVETSQEPWKWDPFNFETGIIIFIGELVVSGSRTVNIPHGHMPISPELYVSNRTSGTFKVTYEGTQYTLADGMNKVPAIVVGGDSTKTLTFTGTARVEIIYRSGSL